MNHQKSSPTSIIDELMSIRRLRMRIGKESLSLRAQKKGYRY